MFLAISADPLVTFWQLFGTAGRSLNLLMPARHSWAPNLRLGKGERRHAWKRAAPFERNNADSGIFVEKT